MESDREEERLRVGLELPQGRDGFVSQLAFAAAVGRFVRGAEGRSTIRLGQFRGVFVFAPPVFFVGTTSGSCPISAVAVADQLGGSTRSPW